MGKQHEKERWEDRYPPQQSNNFLLDYGIQQAQWLREQEKRDGYGIGNYAGDDREAEYTYRDLYRAQWEDYKTRFLPYQEQLIDAATSKDMLDQQLSRITALSSKSKKLSVEAADIARSRYGMQQSQQQAQAFNSNMNLNGALSQASAMNNARSAAYDRYQGAMTGAGIRPQEQTYQTGGATS